MQEIQDIPLSQLKPDKRNARKHTQRNKDMLKKALREVGAARSGVIDEDGNILAGNLTWEVLRELGYERVRVIETDGKEWVVVKRTGLSEEQKRKLALYDNRTAELADWDSEVLREISSEIDISNLWTAVELRALLPDIELPDAAPPEEPRLPAEHVVEIYCSSEDLAEFQPVLDEWSKRPGVTINIS